jgi:hypothetical protein
LKKTKVWVVIQEIVIFHDSNSAAPHFSKEIAGIFFNKTDAVHKKTEIILNANERAKCCYVFIQPHEVT